jgi:hypothetical protein
MDRLGCAANAIVVLGSIVGIAFWLLVTFASGALMSSFHSMDERRELMAWPATFGVLPLVAALFVGAVGAFFSIRGDRKRSRPTTIAALVLFAVPTVAVALLVLLAYAGVI